MENNDDFFTKSYKLTKKEHSNGFKIILIILFILILLGAGYLIYDKYFTKPADTPPVVIKNNIEVLDVTSDQILKLINYIPEEMDRPLVDAYQIKKVTIDDVSNASKLRTTILNVVLNSNSDTSNSITVTSKNSIAKEEIQTTIKKLYGSKVTLTYDEKININNSLSFTLKDNSYNALGGDSYFIPIYYKKTAKATKGENELYIYEKVYFINDSNECISDSSVSKTIYKDASKKEVLGTISCAIVKADGFDLDNYLRTNYKDSYVMYKHTYKLNEDGSYYWYSSEIDK